MKNEEYYAMRTERLRSPKGANNRSPKGANYA